MALLAVGRCFRLIYPVLLVLNARMVFISLSAIISKSVFEWTAYCIGPASPSRRRLSHAITAFSLHSNSTIENVSSGCEFENSSKLLVSITCTGKGTCTAYTHLSYKFPTQNLATNCVCFQSLRCHHCPRPSASLPTALLLQHSPFNFGESLLRQNLPGSDNAPVGYTPPASPPFHST